MRATFLGVLAAACLCGSAASAQDAAQIAASAQKALSAYQFESALTQFRSIPDTAAAEHRLAKHTGASISLQNMGRIAEAEREVELARVIADEIGTDRAMVQFLNAEALYLQAADRGDRGVASAHRAAEIAERAGATGAL